MVQDNIKVSLDGKVSKAKKDKVQLPPSKVVIRKLPPGITEEEFIEAISPLPDNNYFSFVEADKSLALFAFARAYISFVNHEDIITFKEKFDNYVFVDQKGNESPAIIEYAPFQKIPKQGTQSRKDIRCGTIGKDSDYLAFMESLENPEPVKLPQMEALIEEIETHERELKANNGVPKIKTPLLEYIEQRNADRLRYGDKKRRKEFDSKRLRTDERKRKKELRDSRRRDELANHRGYSRKYDKYDSVYENQEYEDGYKKDDKKEDNRYKRYREKTKYKDCKGYKYYEYEEETYEESQYYEKPKPEGFKSKRYSEGRKKEERLKKETTKVEKPQNIDDSPINKINEEKNVAVKVDDESDSMVEKTVIDKSDNMHADKTSDSSITSNKSKASGNTESVETVIKSQLPRESLNARSLDTIVVEKNDVDEIQKEQVKVMDKEIVEMDRDEPKMSAVANIRKEGTSSPEEVEEAEKQDPRSGRRIRNKDRPDMQIYKPGQSRLSRLKQCSDSK